MKRRRGDGWKGQWERNGYGPWAVHVDGEFAGWCGFQQEHGDADFALVLKRRFWGLRRQIYLKAVAKGFEDLGYESIVVTLPPTRKAFRVLQRLGFQHDGETEQWGKSFFRFRLSRHDWRRFANSTKAER